MARYFSTEGNVFHSVEALGEHIGAAWTALDKEGRDTQRDLRLSNNPDTEPKFRMGSIMYHLWAIDRYHKAIFQMLATRLEDEYRRSEGE